MRHLTERSPSALSTSPPRSGDVHRPDSSPQSRASGMYMRRVSSLLRRHGSDAARSGAPGTGGARRNGTPRLVGVGLAAGVLSAFLLAGAPALAVTTPPGLEVTYPDGPVRLETLAPGGTVRGYANVQNTRPDEAAIELSSDWPGAAAADGLITLRAHVCTQAWQAGECAPGAWEVPLDTAPAPAGTLGAGQSWFLQLTAQLDAAAPNDTQDLRLPFTVTVHASGDGDGPPGEPPDGSEPPPPGGEPPAPPEASPPGDPLPRTGLGVFSLLVAAAALIAGGTALLARIRHDGRPRS
ncbi:hypothetical protein [Sediminivirga luteola]|uniref:LPXTG cell wall anchor domain-containing protein n=1 Tax=Sediminivirga luteola TaxID=1774748 RepID=A0A8J2TYR4_9MICO|nr:hypothetical protein [Sediminivirga luteola]MCI2264778.1 hypothetical protein [Sediminivirga luteola]GGA16516.1 hypothetical protein GCM10011333_19530 [Sediminivirga luteola]